MDRSGGSATRIGSARLAADLTVSHAARAIVIFAHGSGSSRLSQRNRHVAAELNKAGLGTLLFDLLSDAEAEDRRNVFDIPLLGSRMAEAIDFVQNRYALLPIGLFGASTGAAAALHAASRQESPVKAIVSRGGRPDLALSVLDRVRAATLLIVGEWDEPVIEMNRAALAALKCTKRLEIVPGATHLFEEPGTLDQVVVLAKDWFHQHLIQGDAT